MERKVTQGLNLTEEQAIEKVKAMGFHPVVADVPPTENEFHWHDFDSVLYVLEAGLDVTEMDAGETIAIRKGDWATAPRGFVHREKHDGFKGVFGLSVDPATLSFPIELPLPVTI